MPHVCAVLSVYADAAGVHVCVCGPVLCNVIFDFGYFHHHVQHTAFLATYSMNVYET